VVRLTAANFDDVVHQGGAFVEFYAPWCGHCKHFAKDWEAVARRVKEELLPIKIAKIDATAEKSIATLYAVSGYPTLLLFRNGGRRPGRR
jgi:protein disulfide-isomerase-like protein